MSEVAQSAVALVPAESNFEGLTKRLLALRAEIDAILTELAVQAMAMPQGVAAMAAGPALALSPPTDVPAEETAQDTLTVTPDHSGDSELEMYGCGPAEEACSSSDDCADLNETAEPLHMTAPEQPAEEAVVLEPIEAEQNAHALAEPACDDPAPVEIVDTFAALDADDATPVTEAQIEMPVAQTLSAEPQEAAAIINAPQPSACEPIESEEHAQQPPAPLAYMDAAASAAPRARAAMTEADEALADAAVIPFHARQRKHKGEFAISPAKAARSGRRLTAKIAAGILVLLTAGTLLMMADRSALGSVPSLSWMPQTPSVPTGIDWLLQRIKPGSAQSSDESAAMSDPARLEEGPYAGYGFVWGS